MNDQSLYSKFYTSRTVQTELFRKILVIDCENFPPTHRVPSSISTTITKLFETSYLTNLHQVIVVMTIASQLLSLLLQRTYHLLIANAPSSAPHLSQLNCLLLQL